VGKGAVEARTVRHDSGGKVQKGVAVEERKKKEPRMGGREWQWERSGRYTHAWQRGGRFRGSRRLNQKHFWQGALERKEHWRESELPS